MTSASLQQCHSNALAASGRLRLPLRSRVWRGQAGEFTGGGTGSSMDFQDHRAYSPGDDPRHINWQAYARTGSYTMKLFREEVRPVVDLIVDASESMFFDETKAARTAELFYLIAESSQAAGASLALHAVRGDASLALDPATLRSHQWLDTARALPAAATAKAPARTRLPLRANALRVFLSDLLFAADPEPILRHLGQRHGSDGRVLPSYAADADADVDADNNKIILLRMIAYDHLHMKHIYREWRSHHIVSTCQKFLIKRCLDRSKLNKSSSGQRLL